MRRVALEGAPPQEVKDERFARLMEAQKAVSADILATRVGCVFLNGVEGLSPGDMLDVAVEHADEYDLWAVPVPHKKRA